MPVALELLHMYPQTITSASTCRKQIAAGWKWIVANVPKGCVVLDFGGGKFDASYEFAKAAGLRCCIYDPYNRTPIENRMALSTDYRAIVCNNVLNVLPDDVIEGAIRDLVLCRNGSDIQVAITVFERDRTGLGCVSGKDQWQRNEKLAAYVPRLSAHFASVTKHGAVLVCR